MLILKALSLGALHGYGVGQRIAQISDDALKIEEGSLYPGLYRLGGRGWIAVGWDASDKNKRGKIHKLTLKGWKQLILVVRNCARLAYLAIDGISAHTCASY